jgi:hypothetical protein
MIRDLQAGERSTSWRRIDVAAGFNDVAELQDRFNDSAMSYIRNIVPCVHTGQNARNDKRGARSSTAAADRQLAVDSAILFADALELVRTLRLHVLCLGLTMADRGRPRGA